MSPFPREVEANVRLTLRSVFGKQFSPAEIERIKTFALNHFSLGDLTGLRDVEAVEKGPLELTPAENAIIGRLVRSLPGDQLGNRARAAYRAQLASGKIRVISRRK